VNKTSHNLAKLANSSFVSTEETLETALLPTYKTGIRVYVTARLGDGTPITKIAEIEQFAPTDVGSGFTGMDPQEQSLDGDIDTTPRKVQETIPSSQSFFTHDTLSYKKYADPEMMNYEGVGSMFGEGLGPQDASENITDVTEGPGVPKSTEKSTRHLPGSLQGQAVLPDVTSWYSASRVYSTDDYDFGTLDDDNLHFAYSDDIDDDEWIGL